MTYATRDELQERFGLDELTQLTDRMGAGVPDDNLVARALSDADAEIDGYLAVRYQLSPETLIGWKAFVEFSAEMPDSVSMMDVLVLASGSCDFNCRVRAEVDDIGRLAESINVEPMLLKTVPVAEWAPRFVQASGKGLISAIKSGAA